MSADEDRRRRAERRRHEATLEKARLSAVERDLHPTRGPEAVSLVTRLTRESWSEAGLEVPAYDRAHTPYRFVPRRDRAA